MKTLTDLPFKVRLFEYISTHKLFFIHLYYQKTNKILKVTRHSPFDFQSLFISTEHDFCTAVRSEEWYSRSVRPGSEGCHWPRHRCAWTNHRGANLPPKFQVLRPCHFQLLTWPLRRSLWLLSGSSLATAIDIAESNKEGFHTFKLDFIFLGLLL